MLNLNFQNGQAPALNARNMNAIVESINTLGYAVGGPNVASTVSAMTDTSKVYVYTGSETGYTAGNWYYYNGSAWVSGGVYQAAAVETDTTLTMPGEPADAKATGDAVADLKSALNGGISKNYIEGKNLDSTTGELISETGTCVSEFIPYTWTGNASYDCGDSTKTTYRIEFYTSSKQHLQGFKNPSSTGGVTYRGIDVETQVTGTVGYVRFSFKAGTVGKIFINAQTTYWESQAITTAGVIADIGDLSELQTTDKSDLVSAINEVKGAIPADPLPIEPKETTFFYVNPNLVNPADNVVGEYVSQTNGEFASNANYTRTDYIPVEAGEKYCIINSEDYNAGIRYAFYTSAKVYISGANVNLSDIGNLVIAPSNAAYVVMSATTNRFPFMIAQSATKIAYVAYGGDYIYNEYMPPEDLSAILINLPSKIYALVGFETNIYYENIVENWESYNFNATCSKGRDMRRGYTITPIATDVGSYTLSIKISTKDDRASRTVSTTLVVASASAGSGETVKLLVLGDSTTANGTVISKLHTNFTDDVMAVETVGTVGTAPNQMEGRGGWTFEFYNTLAERNSVTNPFFNPTSQEFDANYYFTQTEVAKPDWFFINLGINDMFEYTSDRALNAKIEQCIDWCDDMIASVKSASAATKLGICVTIPPNDSQDAFGKAYGCGQTRNRYKRNNTVWANRLIAEYDNRADENIYIVPIHTNLDTVWNMGMESDPVNARNTSVTYQSPIANGGVHPTEPGYWQTADVYTAFLKAQAGN